MSTEIALVTGAGSGTGREYTRLLLAEGSATVVAVSLLADELASLQAELDPDGQRLVIRQADLSRPRAAEDLVQWCDDQGFEVGTLVNNAGFAVYGAPTEVDLERVETMIGLNVVTTLKLAVLVGRRMKRRGTGRILIMGSTAGLAPTPRLGAYCATKAFTNSFGWSLASELRRSGVQVTVVTPGSFNSKFAATAEVTHNSLLGRLYAHERLDATTVAQRGYTALRRGRSSVTVGFSGYLVSAVSRLLPPAITARTFQLI
ncbi:SDR family oxidoreductase [Mycolicibacterium sp. CH28]|uniref:SDR family NAD(P)-dependent oxidoreductase n=1 Tax=Mycolicibacterium sp. CH28 TaxID=2512237 RepID=UPI0013867DA9|nr:SDR family NAD(P)-dependent oxidoreductase [Mycolicibacterium sp. CH28]